MPKRRKFASSPSPLFFVLFAACVSMAATAADAQIIPAGVPVTEALTQLRDRGLKLIYSTALVDPSMQVSAEVSAGDVQRAAREILAPHGLTLRLLGSGVYGVVARSSGLTWTLNGRVIGAEDREPIAQARIEAVTDGFVAWTDQDGRFVLSLVGRERRDLRISAEGYVNLRWAVTYRDQQGEPIQVALNATSKALDEVTIVASRFSYEDWSVTQAFGLDRADIVAQPRIGDDALQALVVLPGIAYSGVSGQPNIRGGEASDALVILDGMPIREPYHLRDYNSAFSAIDDSLVRRIDAYTGPYPLEYGNRLGAVIAMQSAESDGAVSRNFDLSTYNARLRYSQPAATVGGSELLALARIGTLETWLEAYSPDVGVPSYGDLFLRTGGTTASGTTLRAHALWSASKLSYADASTGERARLVSDAGYAWVTGDRVFGEQLRLHGLVGLSRFSSERSGTLDSGLTPAGGLRDSRDSLTWDALIGATWKFSNAHELDFGVSASSGQGQFDYSSEVVYDPVAVELFGVDASLTREIRTDARRTLVGLFLNDRRRLAEDWYAEVGLRIDRQFGDDRLDRGYASPRVALRWNATERLTWRASWSQSYQAEDAHQLRVEDGVTDFTRAQRVDQAILSLEYRPTAGASLRLEGFDRRIAKPRVRYENILDPLRLLPELSPDRVAVQPDTSHLRGVELSAQLESGAWTIWGAYTWSKSEDRIAAQYVPRNWDQRNAFVTSLVWRRGPWSASALASYHSGRAGTPVLDASVASPELGARNSIRLRSYLAIDLRASRRFDVRFGELTAFVQVTNALNRNNECCTEIDLPDEDSDAGMLEVESIPTYPILPALGFTWAF